MQQFPRTSVEGVGEEQGLYEKYDFEKIDEQLSVWGDVEQIFMKACER